LKILFTADWHLKLGQKNVPLTWAINRYLEFFKQVHELEKEVDLHIIGGDVFDRVPTLEELNLYFRFIKNISIPTLVYDGNHEATKKGRTFFTTLATITQDLNSLVTVVDLPKVFYNNEEPHFTILPYCDLHNKNSIELLNSNIPLFTHVRGEIPPHVKPEVDLDRFNKFPIVFAGDLHSHSNCQRNIVYPGSPMTTTFHRSKVETGGIIIEDNWEWSWVRFNLPQLLRKTVTSQKEMKATEYDHTIYELEGDLTELSNVKANDLLDKKVVKRKTEAALLLDKDMTVEEELIEYLTYILEIPETKIQNIVSTFNDNFKKINVGKLL
jgi:DNA repair exonuclease SbcCD nuclease subunit